MMPMIRTIAAILMLILASEAARAQEGDRSFRIGNDAYFASSSVTVETPGLDGVFAAGVRVTLAAPISGTAHLAGRRVAARADVGGDLYAAGADVTVGAPVAGNASLAGYDVTVEAAIGGNLRAGGRNVRVAGPVGGTALIAADSVEIEGVIAGDAAIAAEDLSFGPAAKINGRLSLYGEDANDIAVPGSVVPAERIDRQTELPPEMRRIADRRPTWWMIGGAFVVGVLVVAALASIAAALAPKGFEGLRAIVHERPFRALFIGFLTLSTLIGAAIVLALTLVGLLAAPAVLLVALAMCLLGYLIGVYLLGRGVWGWFGQLPPDSFGERALVALIGAVLVALLALVPLLGCAALFLLTLVGLGALSTAVLRPEFRSDV